MRWFYNLKIAKKLILSFLAVISLAALLGIFSIVELIKVNSASTEITTNWLPSIKLGYQLQTSMSRFRISELQHIVSTDDKDFDAAEKAMTTRMEIIRSLQAKYEPLISDPQEKIAYPKFQQTLAKYLEQNKKLLALSRDNKKDEARALFKGESNKLFREAVEQLEALVKINDDGSENSKNGADHTFSLARDWILGLLVAVIVLAMGMAVWVARIVSVPLTKAVGIAQRVADGDLGADIRAESKDETGQLMSALHAMNGSLLRIVGEVRIGTDTIATASTEIASGNLDLSSRTEQQAGSLEETASAMEELTSTVKQNADNARQANQLAVSASEVAKQGGNVVSQVVETMGEINASSKKIFDIISVIDGIAFQTNILALNAAVEAARAGEQGRGFAVVASEVRSLAQRSAAAAKEIKSLIDDSMRRVSNGSLQVERAGATMTNIVTSVKRVTSIVHEISKASQEQAAGIDQVNNTITQLDNVTQQNSTLVEKATSVAEAMQLQADNLTTLVSVFVTDSSETVIEQSTIAPHDIAAS